MSRLRPALTAIASLFAIVSPAFPISRIGNEIVSENLGFSTSNPDGFNQTNRTPLIGYAEEGIILSIAGSGSSHTIQMLPISQMPGFNFFNRDEFRDNVAANAGNTYRVLSVNSCIEQYIVLTPQAITGFSAWGPQRGIVVTAERNTINLRAVYHLLSHMHLSEGSCQWQ